MTSLPGAGLRRTCAAAQHGADSPGELGNGNEVDSHDDAVAGRHLANATVSGIDRQSIARDDDQASAIAALQDLRVNVRRYVRAEPRAVRELVPSSRGSIRTSRPRRSRSSTLCGLRRREGRSDRAGAAAPCAPRL